jgi:D-alanyl-D-alanine carboxypeptidase
MRAHLLALLALSIVGCGTSQRGSVDCDQARPYEGLPLYSGAVQLPGSDSTLGQAFDAATAQRLDQAMRDAMRHTRAEVMSAAVATADRRWHATLGADGAPRRQRLYWASVGKALTATVVMQLVDEGRLRLDDPLSRWVPGIPNAAVITIDHLLQHTAGVYSANEDPDRRADPRYHAPEDDVAVATRHGALFCPGQYWRYSNTGYSLLGRIIEAVDGRPYHESVNQRIAVRLGLATLRALAPQEEAADVAPLRPGDAAQTPMKPYWGYAAGCVVASADDMLRFWHALTTGALLGRERTASLFERLHPMFDTGTFYGRGVMLYTFSHPRLGARTWLGHSGGSPGIKALVAYSPADQAFVAVALTGDGAAEATANLLLTQLAGGP